MSPVRLAPRAALPALSALAALLLPALSCTEQGTEILLAIRTDLPVPQRADTVVLHVLAEPDSPELPVYDAVYEYPLGAGEGQFGMPVRVSVRPSDHYKGRVVFEVELRLEADTIVAGVTEARFRSDERVDVELLLLGSDALACPGDPPDGRIGLPCSDCPTAEGYQCVPPLEQSYGGVQYVMWADGYCLQSDAFTRNCSIVADNCPAGAKCLPYGRDAAGTTRYLCFDQCNPVDERGVPWDVNCDCRDGYACEPGAAVCYPGCSNDRECCESWTDLDGDGQRRDGEVTPDDGCAGSATAARSAASTRAARATTGRPARIPRSAAPAPPACPSTPIRSPATAPWSDAGSRQSPRTARPTAAGASTRPTPSASSAATAPAPGRQRLSRADRLPRFR